MEQQTLLVVGDGPVCEALVAMADLLGWRAAAAVSVAEVESLLPEATAVVVTSHDPEVDAPAVAAALGRSRRPAYIGGMGSQRTQTRRREWLLANGTLADELAFVHGPAGLDIGADAPAEIALSILAEMVAVLRGVPPQGSLRDRGGPIHPDLPAGEAFSPSG